MTSRARQHPERYKIPVMQRVQDLVRCGFVLWTTDTIPRAQRHYLARKFAVKYATDADRSERQRRRRYGLANAQLVVWSPKRFEQARWWLLVQPDGEHPAQHSETLHDARLKHGRIIIPPEPAPLGREVQADYELVRIDNRWTYRMTPERRKELQQRIRDSVSLADYEERRLAMRRLSWTFRKSPGFRGIRTDVFHLIQRTRSDWKRIRSKNERIPAPLRTPPYVRRVTQPSVNRGVNSKVSKIK